MVKTLFLLCAFYGFQTNAAINGLSFSADTIYGWRSDSLPQRLTINNSTQQDIQIDSVLLLPLDFDYPLYYSILPGSEWQVDNWHVLAYTDPWLYSNVRPTFTIHPLDSFVASSFTAINGYLVKRHIKNTDYSSPPPLTAIFCAGNERDTVIYHVGYSMVGSIEQASIKGFTGSMFCEPNPFSSSIKINLLPTSPFGKINIYNAMGASVGRIDKISSLVTTWTPNMLPNGIYVIQYSRNGKTSFQKVVLLR